MNTTGVRVRHDLRGLFRQYSVAQRRKPGRAGGSRRRSTVFQFGILKCLFLGVLTVSFTLTLIFYQRRRRGEPYHFNKSAQDTYTEPSGDDYDVDWLEFVQRASGSDLANFDPKARPFVDLSLQGWGREVKKGQEKRRLFMRVHKMSREKGRPQLTLRELMALPSTFDPSRTLSSDTTIILNHWRRTTLKEQLEAILQQSVKPKGGVWVCLFDSPREMEYRAIINSYRDRFEEFGGLYFVASSFNFKYYGRFQLALQARTRYVWVIDDDVMPGSKFLQQLSHIAGISDAAEAGGGSDNGNGSIGPMALGSVGWVMPGVKTGSEIFYSYRYWTEKGGLYIPDKRYAISVPHLQEVDLLCSHWFVETDWIRLMFMEKWETSETGEDYMLAYSLRKYAGVRSYVVPMDLTDSETWGNMDVEWKMQRQGGEATTSGGMIQTRDRLWHRLFKRGGEYFLSTQYAEQPRPVLMVITSEEDAEILRPLYLLLEASFDRGEGDNADRGGGGVEVVPSAPRPPRVALAGEAGQKLDCSKVAVALGIVEDVKYTRGLPLCSPDTFSGSWNLSPGKGFPGINGGAGGSSTGGNHALVAYIAVGLQGVVSTTKPLAVVSVASRRGSGQGSTREQADASSPVGEAVSLVSEMNALPSVRLPRLEHASAAALWLQGLSAEAFEAWERPRLNILVVYDPLQTKGNNSGTAHTEAQLDALLETLSTANYLGDTVKLSVVVVAGAVPKSVSSLQWRHGSKVIREAFGDSSGVAHTLRSWVGEGSDDFVLVLEADRVLSPLFYSWLKAAVLETRYSGSFPDEAREGDLCLPTADGDLDDGAWLFSHRRWQRLQELCLPAGAGEGCGRDAFLRPTGNSGCAWEMAPPVALIARADPQGQVLDETSRPTEDPRDVMRLARRVFFEAR